MKSPLKRSLGLLALLVLVWAGVTITMVLFKPNLENKEVAHRCEIGTTNIGADNELLASHPGKMLLIKAPDFQEYKRLRDLSAYSPEEFQQEIDAGNCLAIRDGEMVEVVRMGESPGWVQIEYQGQNWWIMANFVKDSNGETWGVAEMVDKMTNGN